MPKKYEHDYRIDKYLDIAEEEIQNGRDMNDLSDLENLIKNILEKEKVFYWPFVERINTIKKSAECNIDTPCIITDYCLWLRDKVIGSLPSLQKKTMDRAYLSE